MEVGSSLPIDLRFVAAYLRRCARSGLGLTPDQCERTAELLLQSAREADRVVAQAVEVPELEEELLAVASDTDRAAPEPVASGYQAALKAQQLDIQRRLDAEGPESISRPGLAALATRVGDSNVVVMPVAPRPRPLGGGDAA